MRSRSGSTWWRGGVAASLIECSTPSTQPWQRTSPRGCSASEVGRFVPKSRFRNTANEESSICLRGTPPPDRCSSSSSRPSSWTLASSWARSIGSVDWPPGLRRESAGSHWSSALRSCFVARGPTSGESLTTLGPSARRCPMTAVGCAHGSRIPLVRWRPSPSCQIVNVRQLGRFLPRIGGSGSVVSRARQLRRA
jgi:hypothetical protein